MGCRAKAGHTHFIPGPPRAQPPSPLCWGDGASLLIGPQTVLLSEQRPPGTRLRLAMEPMGRCLAGTYRTHQLMWEQHAHSSPLGRRDHLTHAVQSQG